MHNDNNKVKEAKKPASKSSRANPGRKYRSDRAHRGNWPCQLERIRTREVWTAHLKAQWVLHLLDSIKVSY